MISFDALAFPCCKSRELRALLLLSGPFCISIPSQRLEYLKDARPPLEVVLARVLGSLDSHQRDGDKLSYSSDTSQGND